MDQLVGFLLHPHSPKLAKQNRENVEIHPSGAFGTAANTYTVRTQTSKSICLSLELEV